jgi:hypothetical protein
MHVTEQVQTFLTDEFLQRFPEGIVAPYAHFQTKGSPARTKWGWNAVLEEYQLECNPSCQELSQSSQFVAACKSRFATLLQSFPRPPPPPLITDTASVAAAAAAVPRGPQGTGPCTNGFGLAFNRVMPGMLIVCLLYACVPNIGSSTNT